MLNKATKALRGLATADPIKRIQTLESIMHELLWRNPRDVVERHLEVPEPLPQSAIAEGARIYADRKIMLGAIAKGLEVAEVGIDQGNFSRVMLKVLEPSRLHLIDISFERLDPRGLIGANVIKHHGDSSTLLAGFAPQSLDFIYVDGDHSYDGAKKDLVAADQTLKPGGKMICNDYTNWMSLAVTPYGVARAVNEFVIERNYRVDGLALSKWGNHDLLMTKP